MFKVNNKNILEQGKKYAQNEQYRHQNDVIGVTLVYLLLTSTYFTPCSCVSIVNFGQVMPAGFLNSISYEIFRSQFQTVVHCPHKIFLLKGKNLSR